MYVPSHNFFGFLILELHQLALLEVCAQDDVAHVHENDMERDLSVNRTRQNY